MKISIGIAILGLILASTAWAATPNNQACLGHDISTYATVGATGNESVGPGKLFGQAFAFEAKFLKTIDLSLGNIVQLHQSGGVPDELIPNECNNP
jgi:hypothetical protein